MPKIVNGQDNWEVITKEQQCNFENIAHLTAESTKLRGAWLSQLVEFTTLDLGVMSLSPTLGIGV